MVSLAEPKERIHVRSKVEGMDQSADRQRDFDVSVLSAKGKTSTKSFQECSGGEPGAVAFTDVVGATAETGSPLIRPVATFSPLGEGPVSAPVHPAKPSSVAMTFAVLCWGVKLTGSRCVHLVGRDLYL